MDEQQPTNAQPAKPPATPEDSRLARLAVAGAAFATLVLGGIRLFSVSPERFVTSYTNDDSFYFFQVARNVARGLGPSFDGLEWTSGVTPVWAAMLVPVFAVVDDPDLAARSACLLSLALFVLALWLLHRLFVPLFGAWPAAGAVSATLLASPMRGIAILGMDYSCNLLLQVLLIRAYLRLRQDERLQGTGRLLALGMLVGVNCVQRPDTSLLAVLLTLPILLERTERGLGLARDGLRQASLLVAGSLLIGVPYLAGSQLAFGSPMTVSGKIKTHNSLAQLEQEGFGRAGEALAHSAAGPPVEPTLSMLGGSVLGAQQLSRSARHALLALLCAAAVGEVLARARRRRARAGPSEPTPLFAIHGHALLHVLVISVFLFPYIRYGNWYTAPEALSGAALLAAALALLARGLPPQFGRVAGTGLGLLLGVGVAHAEYSEWTRPEVSPRQLEAVALPVARYLHEELPPPARIGVFNAGRLGYYADVHVVNLDGLVNTDEFAEEVWISDQGSFSVRFLRYVLRKDIEWFVDSWIDDAPMLIVTNYFTPRVRGYFELVKRWPTDTTHAVDRPGSYQLVHFDLEEVRRAVEAAGD